MLRETINIWNILNVKSIISPYLMYLDENNLYEWGMSQKLLLNSFKWVVDLS